MPLAFLFILSTFSKALRTSSLPNEVFVGSAEGVPALFVGFDSPGDWVVPIGWASSIILYNLLNSITLAFRIIYLASSE
jgi:hypothetical protein